MSSSVASIAEWQKRVVALVPSLSPSLAKVLGLISYGIVLFDGCGMTRLSTGLGKVEQVPASRLRQRLREFYYEAEAKRGKKRREVDVRAWIAGPAGRDLAELARGEAAFAGFRRQYPWGALHGAHCTGDVLSPWPG